MTEKTSAFWFARAAHYNALAEERQAQDETWSQHRSDAYQCERRARDVLALYGR